MKGASVCTSGVFCEHYSHIRKRVQNENEKEHQRVVEHITSVLM